MAPRRGTNVSASAADTEPNALPCFNGSQMELNRWLRDLANSQHLFESDIAYFLVTGCSVTSAGKTAVASAEQSILLTNDIIRQQEYSIMNPPPVDDRFKGLYALVRANIQAGAGAPFSTATAALFPAIAPTQLPDNHILSPDRIILLDLKLRNVLLTLITSAGRKRHYQDLTQSGCKLLKQFIADAKVSSSAFIQSPHIIRLKTQLEELKKVTLSHVSQVEFDEIQDGLEEINDQLDDDDKMTANQMCDHLKKLIYKLNSTPLWLALHTELRLRQVSYNDVAGTKQCITTVLTSFLSQDDEAARNAASAAEKESAAAKGFTVKEGGKDPVKGGLNKPQPPRNPCPLCGKAHWKKQCFQNHEADADTRKLALKFAPKSPAATGIRASDYNKNRQKEAEEMPEPTTTGASLTFKQQDNEDILAAALDSPNPQTIVVGQGQMAMAMEYSDSDDSDSLIPPAQPAYAMPIAMDAVHASEPPLRNARRQSPQSEEMIDGASNHFRLEGMELSTGSHPMPHHL